MTQPTAKFLEAVWPPNSNYYVAWKQPGDEFFRHRHFENALEATAFARGMSDRGFNVWYALAGFKEARVWDQEKGRWKTHRKQVNVASIRALILDIDAKDYGTVANAAAALDAMVAGAALPEPTLVVDTGGGVHAYWLCTEPLTHDAHRALAMQLVKLAQEQGLTADYQCTVDSARVLRVPGTLNYKYDPPRPVTIMRYGRAVTREQMEAVLGRPVESNLIDVTPALRARLANQTVDNADLGTPYDRSSSYSFALMKERCVVVKEALLRNGQGDDYNLWKNLLHLAAYTIDGEEFIHPLSSGHSGYDPGKTTEKFEESRRSLQTSARAIGPTTCETLGACRPQDCAVCPFKGRVRSPISLGKVHARDQKAGGPSHSHSGATFVWKEIEDPQLGTRFVEQEVASWEMADFRLYRNFVLGETYLAFDIRDHGPLKRLVEIEIPISDLNDGRGAWKKPLGAWGYVPATKHEKPLREALVAWVKDLRAQAGPGSSFNHDTTGYGWARDPATGTVTGFAYDGYLYLPDGTVERCGSAQPEISQVYRAAGDYERWREAAAKLCEDPRIELQLPLAASFAAPLMRFMSDTHAFTLSIRSDASGTGKSTAMRIGATVWGKPRGAMNQLNDTVNALVAHIAQTRDLPAYYDEIRGKKNLERFGEVMFLMTQGREKRRLSSRSELMHGREIHTILTCASNQSLLAFLDTTGTVSDAAHRRVLEFEVARPPSSRYQATETAILGQCEHNYGHAGKRYAGFLATNEKLIAATLKGLIDYIASQAGAEQADRFFIEAAAALIAGAYFAEFLSIAPLKWKELRAMLIEKIRKDREEIVEQETQVVTDLLAGVIAANADRVVVIDTPVPMNRGPGRYARRVLQPPRAESPALIEAVVANRTIAVSAEAVRRFVASLPQTTSMTPRWVLNCLRDKHNAVVTRATIGAGTRFASPQSAAYIVDFSSDTDFWAYHRHAETGEQGADT